MKLEERVEAIYRDDKERGGERGRGEECSLLKEGKKKRKKMKSKRRGS